MKLFSPSPTVKRKIPREVAGNDLQKSLGRKASRRRSSSVSTRQHQQLSESAYPVLPPPPLTTTTWSSMLSSSQPTLLNGDTSTQPSCASTKKPSRRHSLSTMLRPKQQAHDALALSLSLSLTDLLKIASEVAASPTKSPKPTSSGGQSNPSLSSFRAARDRNPSIQKHAVKNTENNQSRQVIVKSCRTATRERLREGRSRSRDRTKKNRTSSRSQSRPRGDPDCSSVEGKGRGNSGNYQRRLERNRTMKASLIQDDSGGTESTDASSSMNASSSATSMTRKRDSSRSGCGCISLREIRRQSLVEAANAAQNANAPLRSPQPHSSASSKRRRSHSRDHRRRRSSLATTSNSKTRQEQSNLEDDRKKGDNSKNEHETRGASIVTSKNKFVLRKATSAKDIYEHKGLSNNTSENKSELRKASSQRDLHEQTRYTDTTKRVRFELRKATSLRYLHWNGKYVEDIDCEHHHETFPKDKVKRSTSLVASWKAEHLYMQNNGRICSPELSTKSQSPAPPNKSPRSSQRQSSITTPKSSGRRSVDDGVESEDDSIVSFAISTNKNDDSLMPSGQLSKQCSNLKEGESRVSQEPLNCQMTASRHRILNCTKIIENKDIIFGGKLVDDVPMPACRRLGESFDQLTTSDDDGVNLDVLQRLTENDEDDDYDNVNNNQKLELLASSFNALDCSSWTPVVEESNDINLVIMKNNGDSTSSTNTLSTCRSSISSCTQYTSSMSPQSFVETSVEEPTRQKIPREESGHTMLVSSSSKPPSPSTTKKTRRKSSSRKSCTTFSSKRSKRRGRSMKDVSAPVACRRESASSLLVSNPRRRRRRHRASVSSAVATKDAGCLPSSIGITNEL